MKEYNHKDIEGKWQKIWADNEAFHAENDSDKPKYFLMVEFPYPSGEGLHVGHPRSYTALDIVARKRRLEGYNVLYPMGWDAFGLPTENYAIKHKMNPKDVTKRNVAHFKHQLTSLGLSFDWDREINTTDPEYYKWTQWIFIQLFKKGLAYKKEMNINWCPSCKIGLANEEVIQGHCERCGHTVEHRVKTQWMLAITKYADRLIDDLDTVDFIDRVKTQQVNWIGRSHGMELDFDIDEAHDKLKVYTTRPDTIFGVSYMVISPEHPLIEKYKDIIKNIDEVHEYQNKAKLKSDFERTELVKEKTGVKIDGLTAINPANGEKIAIYVSDYVLMTYGTGAIMAVPGHDQRDYDFAKAFGEEIKEVISGGDITKEAYTDTQKGILVNSDFLNGLSVDEAKKKIIKYFEDKKVGVVKTNYKLRDWVFSRQRYWGEPIPMVYCEKCGWVPLNEEDLPLTLPDVEAYEPTDTGESPLAKIDSFVNTTCPHCGGPAKRETDTMPNWAGSSWYFLRYTDPKCSTAPASMDALKYWMPVDWYNGGMEHTTLHLLYSRFWNKFLYDIGVVPTSEPYQKRTSHGMLLAQDGEKMSKSRGNVINTDDIVEEYGADTLRVFEMFMGDYEKVAMWSETGIQGSRKFLERVYRLMEIVNDDENYSKDLEQDFHITIKKVSEDFENLKFNTAVAKLMELLNKITSKGSITRKELKTYITLLYPIAPHITEEINEMVGFDTELYKSTWPSFDEDKTIIKTIEIPVQFNGKVRYTVEIDRDASEDEVKEKVYAHELFEKSKQGKNIVKEIYVKNKIFTVVIK